MDKFKIRCSAIGKIMAGNVGLTDSQLATMNKLKERKVNAEFDKAKPLTENMEKELAALEHAHENPELPSGAKTYCRDYLKGKLLGREKHVTTKQIAKGHINEDDALDLVADFMDLGMLLKNEQSHENDFMRGTPDTGVLKIDGKRTIIDIKNSWDASTFPLMDESLPNDDYFYQGQGYMNLLDAEQFIVAYVLTNTPEHMIERECRYYCNAYGMDEIDGDLYDEFKQRMTFDDVPLKYRVKPFKFDRDDKIIKEIEKRVEMCRKYIQTLLNGFHS